MEIEANSSNSPPQPSPTPFIINIKRPNFNESKLNEAYSFQKFKSDNVFKSAGHYLKKYYKPSRGCCNRYIQNRLPIIKWMKEYDIKQNLLKDIIGGLTIGVVTIPQGMAYSLMAGLPAVYGLYVSFFTVMAYFLFGTSRHLSLGTYGVVSLMVKSSISKFEGKLYPLESQGDNHHQPRSINPHYTIIKDNTLLSNYIRMNATTTTTTTHMAVLKGHEDLGGFLSNNPDQAKVMIATGLSFLVGVIQIGLAVLHAGVVTKYLSDVIVSAFTTAAAYHIVASQINSLLGILIHDEHLPFKLVENVIEIFKRIKDTNWATVIISVVSMVLLFLVKTFINKKFKDKLIAPFPIELVIVVFGTLFSYIFDFNKKFQVKIVGTIPLGIPSPSLPPFKIMSELLADSFNIAIVSFALNISMAKLFAKKYNYSIGANQELFAYGFGNFISSFFKGFPSCVGLSRCVILEGTGAKTQLFSGIASALVLVVILGLGFLFRSLPICCLAAIIVVALLHMLTEIKIIIPIFRRSKFEALAWIVTFAAVMILDVDSGLYIGLAFSVLLVVFQNQRAYMTIMGNIPKTDLYEGINHCDEAREIEGIKILRYESSLYFANVENFVYKVIKFSGVNPFKIIEKFEKKNAKFEKNVKKLQDKQKKLERNRPTVISEYPQDQIQIEQRKHDQEILSIYNSITIKHIILDFSCINLIDTMGVDALVKLNQAYKEIGIELSLACCKRSTFKLFHKLNFDQDWDHNLIYPTINDAVLYILRTKREDSKSNNTNNSMNSSFISSNASENDVFYVKNENQQ